MNICILSGRIVQNATARGSEPRTLAFTVETRYSTNGEEKKERSAYVPCVLFNPTPEVEALLTTEGEGQWVELEGRISGSSPDSNSGRRFNTEVIVRNRSLKLSAIALARACSWRSICSCS